MNIRTFVFVRVSVRETCSLTGFASDQSVQIRTCFVLAALFYCVTLRTPLDKYFLSLSGITSWYIGHFLKLYNRQNTDTYKTASKSQSSRSSCITSLAWVISTPSFCNWKLLNHPQVISYQHMSNNFTDHNLRQCLWALNLWTCFHWRTSTDIYTCLCR